MASPANITNFPNGFASGVAIRNLPVHVVNSGRNIWVDSNGPGPGASKGSYQRPYSTVAQALNLAAANDTIWIKSGHVETISAAGGWTLSVTGLKIIGLGVGSERPQITFGTSTGASVLFSAAGCALLNIIGLSGINALTNPINIQASDCSIDIEWRDATSLEALRAVLTNASAVNLTINLKYIGLIGSTTNVNAIRLVGAANIRINIDYYGKPTTAVIEFLTTAGVNTFITGIINNASASTTHAKNIVDTVTGSHWAANYLDIASSATTIAVAVVA
jgi:hypothetical protein